MATTKKTVKTDETDKKKNTTTKKKTTTAKKKTNVKKEAESTGVVDEFLNENIGKVVTETEAPKAEKKTTTKKTDENKLIDAEAELNEILSQQITEENIRVADEIEKAISEQKAKKAEEEKIKDAETQVNEAMKETVTPSVESEGIVDNEESEKTPEKKWNDLGLTSEMQQEIKEAVKEIDNEKDDTGVVEAENNEEGVDFIEKWKKLKLSKGSDEENKKMVSELIEETKAGEPQKPEKKEETVVCSVDDLRVKLQPKEEQQKFNYVNISMGVRFD